MKELEEDKELNPFQKDYFIKQYNDSFYNGSHRYNDSSDNFAYIRGNSEENKTSAIIENVLHFFARYPNFYERTGISFHDFLMMDPSTSDLIKATWSEFMKPEEEHQEEMAEMQRKLNKETAKAMRGGR